MTQKSDFRKWQDNLGLEVGFTTHNSTAHVLVDPIGVHRNRQFVTVESFMAGLKKEKKMGDLGEIFGTVIEWKL